MNREDFAKSILRPDNYELFDIVRDRLKAKPVEPMESIAGDIGVTVDQLCRWVIGFSEKKRPTPYQAKRFAALGEPVAKSISIWSDSEDARRARIAQKARDGARATREALERQG